MPWLLILRSPWTWVGLAMLGLGAWGGLQSLRLRECKAEFAQFRADTERLGAEAKVRAAQELAQHAQHAQEALDDLSSRNAALSASYERLRTLNSTGRRMPRLPDAAPSLSACPGKPDQPEPVAGFLAQVEGRVTSILEAGDREIAKYVELWKLEQRNSAQR
jgi:uncharacterized protein YukE